MVSNSFICGPRAHDDLGLLPQRWLDVGVVDAVLLTDQHRIDIPHKLLGFLDVLAWQLQRQSDARLHEHQASLAK